jgi:serine/threonine protein kinase/Tfp pilus assembly protein PilF
MALSIPQMARMSQLLDEALTLDEAARRAWLTSLPLEHQDLAAALREALLPGAAQAAELNALMSLPKLDAADEASVPAASGLQSRARVGPYELIRLLGAGGMAEVWLARRADGAFKREVALKLPMLARAQAGLEARFARERDILASLEHPHIARLYDAGVDPQGLSYLAMEWVQGEPLTLWSDAHRLGIPERLGLFLQVLEAVQYAHEKQVIHRDLKPSNILVTDAGQVRLLDFGVARLLEAEETDQQPLTSLYGRALTPDYASPELLRGDPIDERSDLYSLGVLLYELLTGTRPYRLKSAASIGLLDKAIATLEVKKPSLQLEPAAAPAGNSRQERLARQLRGDLDAIVLKALAKEPAQRYSSAAAMAEDLRRHLDGKPIQAQPVRVAYRLHKFALRNRALLGVSFAAFAAILVTIGYALYRESHFQVTVRASAVAVPDAPSPASTVAAFTPPAHSVAVLPFVNMSGDKDQEYFSDGLTEELLNSLSRTSELQVAARTSSFYFKSKDVDLATIAHKLNVASVLEGSVRRSAHTVRVTAQLVDAVTGFHLWSQTYDRNLGDILALQTDIANAVASALKVALLGDVAAKFESGGTRNPAAFDAYLRGSQALNGEHEAKQVQAAIDAFTDAIRLDPKYALAFAARSAAFNEYAGHWTSGAATVRQGFRKAVADGKKAVLLAPALGDGHGALADAFEGLLDFQHANQEYESAIALAPGNARVLEHFGAFAVAMGRQDAGVAALRHARLLDPLNRDSHWWLGLALWSTRQYDEAIAANQDALALDPAYSPAYAFRGLAQYGLGDLSGAQSSCETKTGDFMFNMVCLAITYDKLGRHTDAEAMLTKLQTWMGDADALQYAEIYAQWGDIDKALGWLESAWRLRDSGLTWLKVDALLDPLRKEPRFQAIEQALRFPI